MMDNSVLLIHMQPFWKNAGTVSEVSIANSWDEFNGMIANPS